MMRRPPRTESIPGRHTHNAGMRTIYLIILGNQMIEVVQMLGPDPNQKAGKSIPQSDGCYQSIGLILQKTRIIKVGEEMRMANHKIDPRPDADIRYPLANGVLKVEQGIEANIIEGLRYLRYRSACTIPP